MKKANVSVSPELTGDFKKTSTPAQPKSPAKTAVKKESPKKTAKTEQTKKAEVEIVKLEKKSGEVQQKKKEAKPADFDEGIQFFLCYLVDMNLFSRCSLIFVNAC